MNSSTPTALSIDRKHISTLIKTKGDDATKVASIKITIFEKMVSKTITIFNQLETLSEFNSH